VARALTELVLDGLEFARCGRALSGIVSFADLPRLADVLADVLADDCGHFTVSLEGHRDDEGKSWLDLKISGEPMVYCQRCLAGVSFPLSIESRLQLIPPGGQWPDDDLEDDSCDAISAENALSVLSLVEDEVLLALPIAPRHEQCEPPGAAVNEYGASPFAVLAAFRKH
jgi:uncharacterized protein